MATVYKIHPAIGIARVGNSPDEFFIGPERIGEHPNPQGGFKDAQCRVKRQAARFHIYAHHDDGTVEEITDAEADITWTAHLVNKKAANPGRGNTESAADLTIDPGARTLNGPDQHKLFDTGTIKFSGVSAVTVPLGEVRSDDQNRLLVFGASASRPRRKARASATSGPMKTGTTMCPTVLSPPPSRFARLTPRHQWSAHGRSWHRPSSRRIRTA